MPSKYACSARCVEARKIGGFSPRGLQINALAVPSSVIWLKSCSLLIRRVELSACKNAGTGRFRKQFRQTALEVRVNMLNQHECHDDMWKDHAESLYQLLNHLPTLRSM